MLGLALLHQVKLRTTKDNLVEENRDFFHRAPFIWHSALPVPDTLVNAKVTETLISLSL